MEAEVRIRETPEDATLLALVMKEEAGHEPRNTGSLWNQGKTRKWILP